MLSYEKIFSRVRNKIDDLKELSLDDEDLNEIYVERLHSVLGNVRIRRLFSKLTKNDELEQIDWSLKNAVDGNDDEEEEFVIELLALGMVIEWLKPKVETIVNIGKAIGGKEEKVINDSHKVTIQRLNTLESQLSKMIRDHGAYYNDYLQG